MFASCEDFRRPAWRRSAGFPTCCIAVLPACERRKFSPVLSVFNVPPIGNRRYSRLGNLRYVRLRLCRAVCSALKTFCLPVEINVTKKLSFFPQTLNDKTLIHAILKL